MNFVRVIYLLILGLLFVGCAELNNPEISNRDVDYVKVDRVVFSPPRSFLTRGDSLVINIQGLHMTYVCSEITRLDFVPNGYSRWQPVVNIKLPESLTDCPLLPESGLDTQLVLEYADFSEADSVIIFLNTEAIETDRVQLTDSSHEVFRQSYAIPDTLPGGFSLTGNFHSLTDSLLLDCDEKLSYGGYCLNGKKDSLFVKLATTSGWEPDTSCIKGDLLDIEHEFFSLIPLEEDETCESQLRIW